MTNEAVDVSTIARISRDEAPGLATTEYQRFADLIGSLDDDEWGCETECPGWEVRDVACHVLGGMRANASILENVRQLSKALVRRDDLVDALSALQIEERQGKSKSQIAKGLDAMVDPAVKGRKRIPEPLRSLVRIRVAVPGITEWWPVSYLLDVIYTRDTWMHRIDVSRATGREMELTPEHDGRLVEDLVADWASRHGEAFRLHLTGPVGSDFVSGENGEEIEIDTVDFCRILSGRGEGEGLLLKPVPF